MQRLTSRDEILIAAGQHPFARLRADGDGLAGYSVPGALAWTSVDTQRRAAALGDPIACARLHARLIRDGLVPGLSLIELPRIARADLDRQLPVRSAVDWSVLWTTTAPAPADAGAMTALTEADHDEIRHVHDVALSYTDNTAGSPRVRAWWGIHHDGELVAVAGDRSERGVGYLAGIAVLPRFEGRGLGSLLVRGLAARLLAEFGVCLLGVLATNRRADAVFTRAGFTERIELTMASLR